MSFWNTIGIAMADDNEDKADHVVQSGNYGRFTPAMDESIEHNVKGNNEIKTAIVNLPTGKIEARHNACETCGHVAILGNGLCVRCWDYVVNNSSATAKNWPDAIQYREIKARKG